MLVSTDIRLIFDASLTNMKQEDRTEAWAGDQVTYCKHYIF